LPSPWIIELLRISALTAVAVLLGLVTGQFLLFSFLAALIYIYLALHLRQIYRLQRWLQTGNDLQPPNAYGVWGEVYHQLYRRERRNHELVRQLRALLNRFQDSAAALPDAIVALTGSGEIEWLNKAATKLLGLRAPQDIGQSITNLVRQPAFTALVEARSYETSVDIPSPIDDNAHLLIRIVPYGKDERLLVARDVTQLHKLEQVRRDFVANVSHELRTPLTVVSGYLETLADIKDKELADSINAMRQQTARMQHIVDDLLLLARLETDKEGIRDRKPVGVPHLIEDVIREAHELSGGQHKIESRIDPDLLLSGRRNELYSAFSNVLFNAVQYTPAGGTITVSWYGDENGAHFEVADTGPGIAAHHIDRLTERFYRVDNARSRELGGTGLGLAIVKHVLTRHGATLRIDSELGRGSRFICDFPTERIIVRSLVQQQSNSS
jgi:two-component system phosphate regulon sensor histidine kinase PhoR